MTIKTLGYALAICFFSPLFSMEPETGPLVLNKSLLMDYNELFTYLYNLDIDCENIALNNQIKKEAFTNGNVVCAYFFVRNYFRRTATDQTEFSQRLTMMLLCLQRVAYDIVLHYIKYKDTSVFNAFTILKQKMYYLLKTYVETVKFQIFQIHNLDFDNSLAFSTICKASVEHWKNKNWYNLSTYTSWLKFFSWSHAWTPGSYGIYFGPESSQETNDQRETATQRYAATAMALNIFALVGATLHEKTNIFNITYDSQASIPKWEDFFKSFDFPLTKEQIDMNVLFNC